MPIQVRSEIGTLEQVLLHRPGAELEQLVPGELERLLFDDIPYLKAAQQEHDAFAALLRQNGTEVLYLEELMAQTLAVDAQVRRRFIRQFIDEGGRIARHYQPALYEYLTAHHDRRQCGGIFAGGPAGRTGVPDPGQSPVRAGSYPEPLFHAGSLCLHRPWCQPQRHVFPHTAP